MTVKIIGVDDLKELSTSRFDKVRELHGDKYADYKKLTPWQQKCPCAIGWMIREAHNKEHPSIEVSACGCLGVHYDWWIADCDLAEYFKMGHERYGSPYTEEELQALRDYQLEHENVLGR